LQIFQDNVTTTSYTSWAAVVELVRIASCCEENWDLVQSIHKMHLSFRLKGQKKPKSLSKKKEEDDDSDASEKPPPPSKPFNPEGLKFLFNLQSQENIKSILKKIVDCELDTSKELSNFVRWVHREELLMRIVNEHVGYDCDYTECADVRGFSDLMLDKRYEKVVNMSKLRYYTERLTESRKRQVAVLKAPVTFIIVLKFF